MEYRPVRIIDIVKAINRDYFLPAIQRELVWEPARIEKLFDSIMADFPIGSFLFWKVIEDNKYDWAIYEFIRNYDFEKPHNPPADMRGITRDINLVLDGQQRMASIYIGLRGSYRYFYYRPRTTKLYLNLFKEPIVNEDDPEELTYQFEFIEESPLDNENECWYEVGKIMDFEDPEDAKKDSNSRISKFPEELQDNARRLLGRLHARIHTVLVINYYEERSQDYDKVLNIFVRANSAGKPLEYSDLLLSTATAKWEHLDARKEVNDFTDRINETGTGYNFGKDFILKGSLYLSEELPIQYKVKNFNRRNLLKIEENWNEIKEHISTTIRLVSKYGFSSKNIVAPLALLPISFFLMKQGKKSFESSSEMQDVSNQIAIRKWLIFAFLKNAFGGSTDTRLKNIRDIFLGLASGCYFPMKEINQELGIESKLSDDEIEAFLSYSYQGRYTYLVLSLLYPDKDWKDQVYHEDHIFPKSEFHVGKLRSRGYDQDRIDRYLSYYNTVLNLQLLTDSENLSKYSIPFDKWIVTRDDNFKIRHHIPDIKNYDMDLFEDFIENRRAKLLTALKAICDEKQ